MLWSPRWRVQSAWLWAPQAGSRTLRHIRLGLFACLATACAGTAQPSGEPAAPYVDCGTQGRITGAIHYGSPGAARYTGVLSGDGGRAVVLAHQSDESLCAWIPYARALVNEHFRVLAVNLRADSPPARNPVAALSGWDSAVAAAITEVRRREAASVVVIGASLGGCASLVAATKVPGVSGVVSLSGERRVADLDCDQAAAAYRGPLLVVASEADHFLDAEAAGLLMQESASTDKRLLLVPGNVHGRALLQDPSVAAAVSDFVATHSR